MEENDRIKYWRIAYENYGSGFRLYGEKKD